MEWATTTKHQANISVEGKLFNIICESDLDDNLALIINGEYICDVDKLPTHTELLEYIDQQETLNDIADNTFTRGMS